ncbi:hypothetical protein WJX82_000207 [Trebouxia sp. C0006]
MDYTALVVSIQELKTRWIPAKVEQAVQSDKQTLCLRLRTVDASTWLYLCWHPVSGRICTGPSPDRGAAAEAFSFGEQIQSQIKGLVLLDATIPQAWERVVQLSLGKRPGTPATLHIYFEIMGRYSNVVMAEPNGNILLCAYQVGSRMSSARQLQTGVTYQLPPQPQGIQPDLSESFDSWQQNITQAAQMLSEQTGQPALIDKGMVRAYQGVSPALSQEICALAAIFSQDPVDTPPHEWQELFKQWQNWLTRLQDGNFAPGVDQDTGRYSVLGSLPQISSVHGAMHDYHTQSEGSEQFKQLQQQLSTVLTRSLHKIRRKIANFEKQMGSTEESEAIQKQADMLTANIYRWQPGMTVLDVEDWDTGKSVTIPVETGKTVVEVAEGLYKQARKRRRAGDTIIPLLEVANADLAYLQEVEDAFDQVSEYREADDLETLRGIQWELVAGKYMRAPSDASLEDKGRAKGKKGSKRKAGEGSAALQGFRKYTSPAGLQVLVGRNNKQNDELTNRVAKAGDVWMHVRGCPGAHVLLRASVTNRDASKPDLQFAADLAAWHSKGRGEGKCPVIMASPTDIKKPKGAPPGKVLVTKEKTIMGRPDHSIAKQQEQQENSPSHHWTLVHHYQNESDKDSFTVVRIDSYAEEHGISCQRCL